MKYTQEAWTAIIAGFEKSALSIQAYCAQHDISKASFYRHKKKQMQPLFLPVVRKEAESIIFTCNGYKMEVSGDIDPLALSLLLKAAHYD